MKLIYPDNISAVIADEEDANYPVVNVRDKYPKHVWKANSFDAKVTLTVGGGSNGLAIFNCNAREITVTVKDGGGAVVESNTFILGNIIDTYLALITDAGETWPSLWVDYTHQSLQHTIEIDFMASNPAIAYAGIIRAGFVREFTDPLKDLDEGRVDYSIVKELNNGAFYTRKRDVVKTFSGEIRGNLVSFNQFMTQVYDQIGPDPIPTKVISTINNQEFVVFARHTATPTGRHQSRLSFFQYSIIEVV